MRQYLAADGSPLHTHHYPDLLIQPATETQLACGNSVICDGPLSRVQTFQAAAAVAKEVGCLCISRVLSQK